MTRTTRLPALAILALLTLVLGGCATPPPAYDYTAFRQSPPRSILVLPPLDETTSVTGPYSYLATVSRPIAERGYYVFPVAVVDQLLKQNGMPTPGEMHQVPLDKLRAITGADAVLYPVLHAYGSKYVVFSSTTTVDVSVRLVDTRSGALLWEGHGMVSQGSDSGNQGLLGAMIGALVAQVINAKTDPGYQVSRMANNQVFFTTGRELPPGPYHPDNHPAPQQHTTP
jgi:hypothetical protein